MGDSSPVEIFLWGDLSFWSENVFHNADRYILIKIIYIRNIFQVVVVFFLWVCTVDLTLMKSGSVIVSEYMILGR